MTLPRLIRRLKRLDPRTLSAFGALLAGAGLATYAGLGHLRMALISAAYGPICGHAASQPHCAACYSALAAAGLGAAMLASGVRRPALRRISA